MALEIDALIDAVASHAMTIGYFDSVNEYEPKGAPGYHLTAAVWAQSIGPLPSASGLSSTTGRVVMNVRLYTNMLQEPQDAIDPNMIRAIDALLAAYSGDFTLDGLVRNVDLLGQFGIALQAEAGYLEIDSTMYRIFTIDLPLIVNDLWEQAP